MTKLIVNLRPGSVGAGSHLQDHLGADIEVRELTNAGDELNLEPVTVALAIVATAAAVGLVTRVTDWVRERSNCLVVVDARVSPPHVNERCDIDAMRGQVILIGDDENQVRIERRPPVLDIDGLLKTMVESSIGAARSLVKESGGEAVTEPAGKGLD